MFRFSARTLLETGMITEAKGLIFMWNGQEAESQLLRQSDQTLRRLRRGGIHLTLATTAARTSLVAFLKQTDVSPMRFDKTFAREEVAPDIADGLPVLTKAVNVFLDFNLLENQVAVVGNTLLDMQQARLVRVGFIAVATDVQRQKFLEAGAVPEHIVPDIEALPGFLGVSPGSAAM